MVGHTSDLFFVYRQRSAEPIDRESFKYGTGDVTPRPLGGSGFGACYEAGKKYFCDSLVTPQQEFRYGSGSVALKPLGGSGRGIENDRAATKAKARPVQRGVQRQAYASTETEDFRYGSRSAGPYRCFGL